MRLWDYRLLKVLPDRFIVSQWRECIAIKRQWEKGTLKHRLVSYVMDHDSLYFCGYLNRVKAEIGRRGIKCQEKYYNEIINFCISKSNLTYPEMIHNYPEHNGRYLKQYYYNLQEKADRGIITKEEWQKIQNEIGDDICEYKFF